MKLVGVVAVTFSIFLPSLRFAHASSISCEALVQIGETLNWFPERILAPEDAIAAVVSEENLYGRTSNHLYIRKYVKVEGNSVLLVEEAFPYGTTRGLLDLPEALKGQPAKTERKLLTRDEIFKLLTVSGKPIVVGKRDVYGRNSNHLHIRYSLSIKGNDVMFTEETFSYGKGLPEYEVALAGQPAKVKQISLSVK
jgi:hypothetical protein